MVRPTLENGDIWSEDLANASIRPQVSENDLPGHLPPLTDSQLSSAPGNIKSNFYGFYDRIKLSVQSGLIISYTGSPIGLSNGEIVILNAGSIFVPDNATTFVFVNSSGNIDQSAVLPYQCIPLGMAVAVNGEIISLSDMRDKVVEQVRPVGLPPQTAAYLPGDIKATFRSTLEPGFVWANGQPLTVVDYPGLFTAIGYTYGGSGSTFNVPDLRGRTLVGVGQGAGLSDRNLGQTGGAETHTLSSAEMPSHIHSVNEGVGHTHPTVESPHTHLTSQDPHKHNINDPTHDHTARFHRGAALNASEVDGSGAEVSTQGTGNLIPTTRVATGITVLDNLINISVNPARSGVSVGVATTGIQINASGGNAAHNNMPPFATVNYMVKT